MSEAERLADLFELEQDPESLYRLAATELRRLQAKVDELLRWKSIHAPRLVVLEGLLATAQLEAAQGAEARATLASERQANAILTSEVEKLRVEVTNRGDWLVEWRKAQAEVEALQKWRDEADILATYSHNDGRREWVTVGTWLRPGEIVAHMAARPGEKHD